MANLNQPMGFSILNPEKYKPEKLYVNAAYAGKPGDVVWIESSGLGTDTAGTYVQGIQVSAIIGGADQIVKTPSGDAGADYILVVADPAVEFTGQMTTGALTDPYTTVSGAACFDIAGAAGVMYVDAGAHTRDEVRVIRDYHEPDTGILSAVGAYAKKVFKFSPLKHARGSVS